MLRLLWLYGRVLTMTKEEIQNECMSLRQRLDEIESNAKMELSTAMFLQKQADKLMEEHQRPETTFERNQQILKEMEGLQARMMYEAKHIPDANGEMARIHARIVELANIWKDLKYE